MNELAIRALAAEIFTGLVTLHEGDFRVPTMRFLAATAIDAADVFAASWAERGATIRAGQGAQGDAQ